MRALAPLAALEAQLAGRDDTVPLLVVRLPELERIAWRSGLRAARSTERRAAATFAAAVARVLRTDDLVAHDPGSDVFLAALVAPMRSLPGASPVDLRAALARIAATMEAATRLEVSSGWTVRRPGEKLQEALAAALARGAQERERYGFFSAVGHELRTPLASIRGYLETLLEDDLEPATRRRFVRIAHAESLRLTRLIDGMFELSLLDLQETIPSRGSASLALALESATDACAGAAAARDVRIETALADDLNVAIDGDRLTLVVINLLENAIKHGRSGGFVRIAAARDGRRLVSLTVDDDGRGIAPADRERVFALGERGRTGARGSGIGLALVRLMLERVGGRVELDASPLGGARFTITLPLSGAP